MNNIIPATSIVSSEQIRGFIKVWQTDPKTGQSMLLVDKPNMVLYSGADIMSRALAGVKNAHISHMYIGYYNDPDNNGVFLTPVIDKAYSAQFQNFASPFGYLRLPLSFPVTFLNSAPYDSNVGIYSVVVSANNSAGGASFKADGNDPSWIYEIALVAALNPTDPAGDMIFSRANFTPIRYVLNYNLTISWGIEILAE